MSFGIALPVVALLGATPERPVEAPTMAPVALAMIQVAVQPPVPSGTPDAVTNVVAATDPSAVAAAPSADRAPDAIVIATPDDTPGDPLEGFNRHMFALHQSSDRKFFRPVAMGYRHVVPKQARIGLRNFFSNLGEPIVFLNDLLQLKPGRAGKTLARFVFNSTIGIGGLVDVAKSPGLRLPHRDNGFGNTLAYYGVGPGPYLFLPFVGPTTLRDLLGGQGDGFILPLAVGKPFNQWEYQVPRGIVRGLDQRAESDADLKALLDSAVDPYATLRSVYLQNRAGEIRSLHSRAGTAAATGNPLDTPLSDPAAGEASPLDDPLTDPATTAPPQPADDAANQP